MKKIVIFFILLYALPVHAEDCCKNHGGENTCSKEGMIVCVDGFVCKNSFCIMEGLLPEIKKDSENDKNQIAGCTDKSAKNYNQNAGKEDGSCIYYQYGCTDKDAINYDEKAEREDGSCIPKIYGCTDKSARNYDSKANISSHTCEYRFLKEIDKEIPYKIEIKKDKTEEIGKEEIVQKGITGRMKVKYEIIVNGEGKEIEKNILEENILRKSQNKIIKEGSKNSIYHRTLFLYGLCTILLVPIFLKTKTEDFYILKEIRKIRGKKKISLCKILVFIIYFSLVLPVLIDGILVFKNEMEKRI